MSFLARLDVCRVSCRVTAGKPWRANIVQLIVGADTQGLTRVLLHLFDWHGACVSSGSDVRYQQFRVRYDIDYFL